MSGVAVEMNTHAPVVVHVANAFMPETGRRAVALDSAMSIDDYLDRFESGRTFTMPTVCTLNGGAVLRDDWSDTVITPGDVCVFIALPHGGGGGGGGKSPLKTVLMIAVIVAASWAAGAFAPGLGSAMFGGHAASGLTTMQLGIAKGIIGGAVTLVGQTVSNMVVPQAKPTAAAFSYGSSAGVPSPSPTYSLTGQGNSARLGQPIACQFGRHMVYPDLIQADPYTEYVGNDQFLYQAHCIGLGEYDIEKIRIAETDITNFDEVTTEIVAPGVAATLFDINVLQRPEVAGQDMPGTNEQDGVEYVGPFVVNPVDTTVNDIGIDVIFPRGLYLSTGGGLTSKTVTWVVEARLIDDNGDAVPPGTWTTLGSESHTATDNSPIRLSYKYVLATPGRYELQTRRTDIRDTTVEAGHSMNWTAMRAYVDGPDTFEDVTLLLVKMRATSNLSARSSRLINVLCTRKLPVWNDTTKVWSAPVATRSIVWALAEVARASYGGGLADVRLPLSDYAALDATYIARGDTFNAVFDSRTTVYDALTRVARVGRAVPILQNGRVMVFRDEPLAIPTGMFGPRNIVKGSFEVSWILPGDDTADAVTVEFFNERTWKPDEITIGVPDIAATDLSVIAADSSINASTTDLWQAGVVAGTRVVVKGFADPVNNGTFTVVTVGIGKVTFTGVSFVDEAAGAAVTIQNERLKPATIPLFGCTVEAQARKEGIYMAADNVFRRVTAKLRTEMDGMLPTYGSLIAVSHDMPRWGQGGEVVAWDDVGEVLSLSEPLDWSAGGNHYILLRRRDGSGSGPYEVEAVAGQDMQVHLLDSLVPGFTPYTGSSEESTYFSFGPADKWARLCRLLAMRPRSRGEQVELVCVGEDARVHQN